MRVLFPVLVLLGIALAPLRAETPGSEPGDDTAIELAQAVLDRMGGQKAWDHTRLIGWEFFGRRYLFWDKKDGLVRVEGTDAETDEPVVVIVRLGAGQGRAFLGGELVVDEAKKAELLDWAEEVWINDSYWLVMPYKLLDPGVHLRLLGERTMTDGRPALVLEVTFEEVGRTPENKYHVYVGEESGLVEQWDYYASATDETPTLSNPWGEWLVYGDILLSGDRGDRRLERIGVYDSVPVTVFTSPQPADLD